MFRLKSAPPKADGPGRYSAKTRLPTDRRLSPEPPEVAMSFTSLRELEEREVFPGFHGRFVHTDNMTFVYWVIDAGAPLPPHAHPHEQVAHMFEGRFELTIGETTRILEPGSVAAIPSNTVHSGKALTRCRIMDVFCPIREDYR